MRKIVATLLALLMLLSMTACGNKKVSSTSFTGNEWPRSEVAKLIPQPDFGTTEVKLDTVSGFSVEVSKATQNNFSAYAETCMDNGFTVDYRKTDTSFHAENEDGFNLSVYYWEAKKQMDIRADAPSNDESSASSEGPTPTPKPTPKPTPTPAPESSEEETPEVEEPVSESEAAVDGIRPEFKEAMDSYEAFYQEYADFMKEYSESDNALGMLGEYTEYMKKLVDMSNKFDELGDEDMSDEELKYYLDVQTRVTKLLLDIA